MDKFSGLPAWVQRSKKSLKQSQEWQSFMMKLYDLVHHQMQDMGIGSFNDLAPPERHLLLQRAFHALKSSETYLQLLEAVSESLDESISKETSKLSVTKQQNKTKIEILQEECHKAVTALLQKWPDSRSSLRQCLNANIPLELRYVMWKNFLRSPKVREEYLMLVASNPKKLVSQLDFEISEKCQMLLESDPTLRQIPNRKTVCSVMRHLLSYRHSKTGGTLVETDFLLAIPPVVCTLSAKRMLGQNTVEKQLTTESLATLVEEFFAFVDKTPDYMRSMKGRSLYDLSRKTAAIIRKQDPALARAMKAYKIEQKQLPDANLESVLQLLLHSIVRSMFVGYFPLETVLHAWDIIVLGFDHADYDPVPYICATVFLLLHKDLTKCHSEKEASTVLIQGSRSVQKDQLMLALKEYNFEKQLKENLNVAEEEQFPVFHPALKSNLSPWKHWYSDKIIAHLQSERRDGHGKRAMPHQTDPSSSGHRLADGHDETASDFEQMKLEFEDEAERLREERDALAEDVEKERRLRIEVQQQADEEIERLRRELNALRRTDALRDSYRRDNRRSGTEKRTPTLKEAAASPARSPVEEKTKTHTPKPETPVAESKAPTPAAKTSEPPPVVESHERAPETSAERKNAEKMIDDFLLKMMGSVALLARGNQREKGELDRKTKKDSQRLTAAARKAQISVYGAPMSDEEILKLPRQEREQKLAKMQSETMRLLFKK